MKMTLTSRLTERGQVSVPIAIRNGMNLIAGQRIVWEYDTDSGVVFLTPMNDRPVGGAQEALGFAGRFRATYRTDYWLNGVDDVDVSPSEERSGT